MEPKQKLREQLAECISARTKLLETGTDVSTLSIMSMRIKDLQNKIDAVAQDDVDRIIQQSAEEDL